MRAAFTRLRNAGIDVSRVVDVGAFRAQWTHLFREVYPAAHALLIEPQSRHADALRSYASGSSAKTVFVPALVGADIAEGMTFHVLDDEHGGTGSSVMRELSNVEGHVESMSMTTLEEVIDRTGFGVPEFVKIDVQGYELEVLKGLGGVLASVSFVLLEVAVIRYNEGAPQVLEVLQFMEDRGFALHDLVGETRLPDGLLAQVDILFVRADHPIRTETTINY